VSTKLNLSIVLSALLLVPALVTTTALTANQATAPGSDAAASVSAPVASDGGEIVLASAVTAVAASKKKSSVIKFTPAKVVKMAKKFAGTRYRFGGDSPSGFDCSGFTKYVYAKFGVDLPHSAWKQGKVGKRISKAKAKPGDLVITSGGSHVGIWVSKDRFIDSPRPGQVVHVRDIYTSNYIVVRIESDTSKA